MREVDEILEADGASGIEGGSTTIIVRATEVSNKYASFSVAMQTYSPL